MPVLLQSVSGSQLPLTVSDIIAATRDHLMGTYQSEWTVLTAPVAATDTTMFLNVLGGAVRTAYLGIEDEIVFVQQSSSSAGSVTVIRGFDGTTAQPHAANTLVEVKPRFPRHMIRRQLALEIASWPDNLFQVVTTTLQLLNDGMTFAYDLGVPSADILYLLDARHAPWQSGMRNTWPQFYSAPRLNRSVDTNTFPSGVAFEITDAKGAMGNVECRVTYATGFAIANLDDAVLLGAGGIGLSTSMLDIPALGAAARLLGPRDALRTFGEAQDQARSTQDVPPGAATKTALYLKALRDQRIAEEIEHLNVTWPMRCK